MAYLPVFIFKHITHMFACKMQLYSYFEKVYLCIFGFAYLYILVHIYAKKMFFDLEDLHRVAVGRHSSSLTRTAVWLSPSRSVSRVHGLPICQLLCCFVTPALARQQFSLSESESQLFKVEQCHCNGKAYKESQSMSASTIAAVTAV